MAQKLYLVWDQNTGHFTDGVKRIASPTLFRKKFMNRPQRIVHVIYLRRMYKTLDLYSYLYVLILFCKLKHFKHIQESVDIVIYSKSYTL